MKLGPVIKIVKRNKATSRKVDDDVMSVSCSAIVVFSIYGQFRTILKPDSSCIVYKTYNFINSALLQKLKT